MRDKFNFVFCRHSYGKKDYDFDRCYNCERTCPSISNILHGKVFKLPIIKQIYDIWNKIDIYIQIKKYNKNYINEYETTKLKHIWGIKSWDDLSGRDCNLLTMNDIALTYLKDENKYILGIETIYEFKEKDGYIQYLEDCLKAFTEFMISNNYDINKKPFWCDVFSYGINMNTHFDSIEDCYSMFKLLVKGYTNE